MKRARVSRFGEPGEVVELVEVELLPPGPGEALVEVEASPINPADLLRCQGLYGWGKSAPALPFWAGVEGAGRVLELGPGVTNLRPGDLVPLARLDGVWGERLLAKASALSPLPAGMDPLQAAMLTVNPATAALLLEDFVALRAGEWLLQNAANSAVGGHVIKLAKARNCRTVNVVRRAEAAQALSAAGGDAVLVDGPDLVERVEDATGGAPLRLALDAVGGEATARLAGSLAEGGTVVSYGLLSGEAPRIPGQLVIFHDVRLRGFWLPRSLAARTRDEVGQLYRRLAALLADGTLKVPIAATYPLERLPDALAHAARAGRAGKVLITP